MLPETWFCGGAALHAAIETGPSAEDDLCSGEIIGSPGGIRIVIDVIGGPLVGDLCRTVIEAGVPVLDLAIGDKISLLPDRSGAQVADDRFVGICEAVIIADQLGGLGVEERAEALRILLQDEPVLIGWLGKYVLAGQRAVADLDLLGSPWDNGKGRLADTVLA